MRWILQKLNVFTNVQLNIIVPYSQLLNASTYMFSLIKNALEIVIELLHLPHPISQRTRSKNHQKLPKKIYILKKSDQGIIIHN